MRPDTRFLVHGSFLFLVLSAFELAAAQKLDEDAKRWRDGVAPLILPDENKTLRSLKDPADIAEFQKIFWARRDPDLSTPENEFQSDYERRRGEVDKRFTVAGRPGTTTDCGKVFVLLGPPDEVKADSSSPDAQLRTPEVWTYRDRPGFTFSGGKMDLPFNGECQLPRKEAFDETLLKVAESKVVQPTLEYRLTGGRLTKLADLLPKASPVQGLLAQPRQDFPFAATPVMQIRGSEGATYIAGLVRGDASGLGVQDAAGQKTLALTIAAQLLDETGKAAATSEREALAEIDPDKSFVASFGVAVRPGKYTLKAAAYDSSSKKGSSVSAPLEVADYGTGLTVSNLLVVAEVAQGAQTDPKHALAAFALGNTRLGPRFENEFTRADSVQILAIVYGVKPGPAGKPSVTAAFTILRDGKEKAKAPDQNHDTETPTPAVGPVALGSYEPGAYTARLKVKDNVSGEEVVKEATFEVKP